MGEVDVRTAVCAQGICYLNIVVESIVVTIASDFFTLLPRYHGDRHYI